MPNRKKPWIHALLQKEVTRPQTFVSMEQSPTVYESHTSTDYTSSYQNGLDSMWEVTTHFTPTIPPSTMTTDEIFSHYKQPEKAIHGPMYLIIQGHSKVKTYGQNVNGSVSIPKIVPVSSTTDPVIKHVVSDDEDVRTYEVKHLHKKQIIPSSIKLDLKQNQETKTNTTSTMGSLLSLLDTSFGDFFLNNEETLPVYTKNSTSANATNIIDLNSNEMLRRH